MTLSPTFVLVTDEASLYDARSFEYFDGLHAVVLVQRPESTDGGDRRDLAKIALVIVPKLRVGRGALGEVQVSLLRGFDCQ